MKKTNVFNQLASYASNILKQKIDFSTLLNKHQLDSLEDGDNVVMPLGHSREDVSGYWKVSQAYQINASRTGQNIRLELLAQATTLLEQGEWYSALLFEGELQDNGKTVVINKICGTTDDGEYGHLKDIKDYTSELFMRTGRLVRLDKASDFINDAIGELNETTKQAFDQDLASPQSDLLQIQIK